MGAGRIGIGSRQSVMRSSPVRIDIRLFASSSFSPLSGEAFVHFSIVSGCYSPCRRIGCEIRRGRFFSLPHESGAKPSPISFRPYAIELIVFEGPILRRPFGKRYLKANEGGRRTLHWIGGRSLLYCAVKICWPKANKNAMNVIYYYASVTYVL